jgi:uncharacterized protein YkwD
MSEYFNNFIEFLFRERWQNKDMAAPVINAEEKNSGKITPEIINRTVLKNRARILGIKIDEIEKSLLYPEENIAETKKSSGKRLKHFFIPHKDNNYRPHALHPGRIALYSAAAVAIKIILAATVISFPLDAIFADDASAARNTAMIKSINTERTGQGLQELKENRLLDHIAYLRAQELLSASDQDTAAHSGVSEYMNALGYEYSSVSENIAGDFYDPGLTVSSLLKSDSGKESILDKGADEIGLGIAYSGKKELGKSVNVIVVAQKKQPLKDDSSAPVPADARTMHVSETSASSSSATTTGEVIVSEPEITNLENGKIFRDGNLKLDIFAPMADMVVLYADNEEKILKDYYPGTAVADNGHYDADISLSEGQHYILAKAIKGKYERYSKNYALNIDYTPPSIDRDSVNLQLSPSGGGSGLNLDARVFLSSDTSDAYLFLGNYRIPLVQSGENANQFSGNFIVEKTESKSLEILKNQAIIIARDEAGNSTVLNLGQNQNTGLLATYKKNSAAILSGESFLRKIMDSGALFYQILLVFASIVLILNIFIEIHVQRPGVIFSACGLILLMAALILV